MVIYVKTEKKWFLLEVLTYVIISTDDTYVNILKQYLELVTFLETVSLIICLISMKVYMLIFSG